MRRGLALFACLAGCAGGPPVPDWQANAHAALAAHTAAYLAGRDRAAVQELARARAEVARTGDAAQLARVELAACAARFASLSSRDCPAFTPLAQDADPAARAYADYLAGRWEGLKVEHLPPAQQAVMKAHEALAALRAIEEPLSRLVAAAMLFYAGRLPPAGIELAIETAAQQGWRRPLLAWLGVARDRLAAAGRHEEAAAYARRMAIVSGEGSAAGR
ncbi:MAG: hypothetical protein N3C63_06320 [Rhodocyclaceae bacterium]|nr:hypothetical protein [Rhodocyclaceae bacterium]